MTTDSLEHKPVIGLVRDTVEANLLKYAAGRAIACPGCGEIMDWRTTVLVSIYAALPEKPEKAIKDYLQCGSCWDKNRHHLEEGLEKTKARITNVTLRTEVVDGRDGRFDWIE